MAAHRTCVVSSYFHQAIGVAMAWTLRMTEAFNVAMPRTTPTGCRTASHRPGLSAGITSPINPADGPVASISSSVAYAKSATRPAPNSLRICVVTGSGTDGIDPYAAIPEEWLMGRLHRPKQQFLGQRVTLCVSDIVNRKQGRNVGKRARTPAPSPAPRRVD
jgi:hypothetical protein